MGMSLFEKARTVIVGNLHDLLDRQVQTPDGYRQLIRDLEEAMADVRAGTDEAVGTANGYRRAVETRETNIVEIQSNIDLLLGDDDPGNDVHALDMQLAADRLTEEIEEFRALLIDQEMQVGQLRQALTQLEAKRQQMLRDLNKLTQTQAVTKAKNRASSAVEAAVSAASSVDGASVDSIADRLNRERDVADARFDRVVGDMQAGRSPEAAARLARAKQALAARRATLTQQAQVTEAEPTPADA